MRVVEVEWADITYMDQAKFEGSKLNALSYPEDW